MRSPSSSNRRSIVLLRRSVLVTQLIILLICMQWVIEQPSLEALVTTLTGINTLLLLNT